MSSLTIPNAIVNGQTGDATVIKQNFDAIANFANTEVLQRDGSVAATNPIPVVTPTAPTHAATKAYVDAVVPIGVVLPFGGDTAPAGYLLARGQAVSRATYSALFGVYGTRFGAGDGTTTFNLPDYRSRYMVGYSDIPGIFAVGVGEKAGSADSIVPSHTHNVSITSSGQSANHFHSGSTGTESALHKHGSEFGTTFVAGKAGGQQIDLFDGGTAYDGGTLYGTAVTGTQDTLHTHAFNTTGASVDHTHLVSGATATAGVSAVGGNLPPSMSINFIVKVA